jgi:hypothetical protein
MRGIGHSANRSGYNLRDWAWGVPLIPVLTVISEQFLELRVIGVTTERLLHGLRAENECVCGELNPMICDPLPYVPHEYLGIFA